MEPIKEFKTANDFREFLQKNCPNPGEIYVKEVYNTGENQYPESPLFIYSGYSIIMIYLSETGISLKTYDKDFFIQHIRGGFFREDPDSEEIYSISFPHAKLINSFVEEIDIDESEEKTLFRIDLAFKNGQHLCAEPSSSVPGTMTSYIYG